LELQAGLRRFIARLVPGDAQAFLSRSPLGAEKAGVRDVPIGSRLEVTGVYAGRGGNLAAGRDIDSFELLVNSPSDILVLSRPPWWTLRRVLWVLGGLCLALVVVMVWVLTLRRRVRAQTEIIRQKIQRETVWKSAHGLRGSSMTLWNKPWWESGCNSTRPPT